MASKWIIFSTLIILVYSVGHVTSQLCPTLACQNGGTCIGGTSCSCVTGYTGAYCETDIDECNSEPCQNGGTCNDGVNSYSCACAAGYTGATCATNIDECQSDPCANGGTCSNLANAFSCACLPGYSGTQCETNIDECQSSPCQNNARCVDGVDKFSCTCPALYTGNLCELRDVCLSNPCQNGGTCALVTTGYECICAIPFYGTNCEIEGKTQTFFQTIRIPDVNFDAQLSDLTSETATNASKVFCDAVEGGYATSGTLSTVTCTVTGFRQGSVIIDYTVQFTTPTTTPTLSTSEVLNEFNNTAADIRGTASANETTSVLMSTSPAVTTVEALGRAFGKVLAGGDAVFSGGTETVTVTDLDECAKSSDNTCDTNAQCINSLSTYSCSCNSGYLDKSPISTPGRSCLFVQQRLEFWVIILIALGAFAFIVLLTAVCCQALLFLRRSHRKQQNAIIESSGSSTGSYEEYLPSSSSYYGGRQAPFHAASRRIWRSAESTTMASASGDRDDLSDFSEYGLERPRYAGVHSSGDYLQPYVEEENWDFLHRSDWQ